MSLPVENKRLKHLIQIKSYGSENAFAKEVGVSAASINRLFRPDKRNGEYPSLLKSKTLLKAINDTYPDITADWFSTEEVINDNLKQNVFNGNHIENNKVHEPEGKIIDESKYSIKNVHIIPVKGRGGLSNYFYADEMIDNLDVEEMLVEQASKYSKYFKIEVEGVSMDDGSKLSLAEGDWAYCRSIPKIYWHSKLHAHKWDIFAFFHNERGIIFKKILRHDVDTGTLILGSIHPDKETYPDFEIKLSECSYVCNVIKVLTNL